MNEEYQNNQLVQDVKVVRRVILIETRHPKEPELAQAEELPPTNESREKNVFPRPANTKVEGNHFFCASDRIISLYNKANRDSRKKMTSTVQRWFKKKALTEGWMEAIFLQDTHTTRIAGRMLLTALVKGSINAAPH